MPTVPVCEAAIVAVAADTTGRQGRLVGPLLSIEEVNDMLPTQDAQLDTIALRWFRDTSEGDCNERFDPAVKLIDLSLTRTHMIGVIKTDNAGEEYSRTTHENTGRWVRQVCWSRPLMFADPRWRGPVLGNTHGVNTVGVSEDWTPPSRISKH